MIIQLAISGQQLGCFGLMLVAYTVVLTVVFVKTNNEYRVMKQQTKGLDYDERVVKLWRLFIILLILCLLSLCAPFLLIQPETYFI